jgi:hypothetical protein
MWVHKTSYFIEWLTSGINEKIRRNAFKGKIKSWKEQRNNWRLK